MTPDQWFELGQWLVGGAIGAGSVLVGSLLARRRPPAQSALVCSCRHGYGTHDPIEGSCGGTTTVRRNYTDVVDPCPCRSYDGPDPLTVR